MSNTQKQECDAPDIEASGTALVVVTDAAASPSAFKEEIPYKATLRCALTESELVAVAQDICRVQGEIDDLTEAKKASAASYAERIKNRTSERDDLMMKFQMRAEDRLVDCVWKLNVPEPGMKTAYRLDTNEPIGVEAMTTKDRDQDLPGMEPEMKPAEDAEVVDAETDSAAGAVQDDFPEDDEESAEDARVDAIIDGLKDDEEEAESEGDF